MRYRRPCTMGVAFVFALSGIGAALAQTADQPVTSYLPVVPTEHFTAKMERMRAESPRSCSGSASFSSSATI